MRLFCWPKEKDRDMTKTFEQHAAEAQMTEADRIAHAATWDAAIEAAEDAVTTLHEQAGTPYLIEICGAIRAIATE
jgi:hypothetical protein